MDLKFAVIDRFNNSTKIGSNIALSDIGDAIKAYRLAGIFGWQDVAQRYRRSRVGAFWLTLNMAVFVSAVGFIFGTLFQSPMRDFLPYLCAGVIVWGFINTSIAEGCTAFSGSEGLILQVKMPLFTHIMRALWRNIIILMHNIVILPIVLLVTGGALNWNALLALPGLLLVTLNLAWIMLVLAVICLRFRDMTQVVTNILQVMFYATPIMWMLKSFPENMSKVYILLNPFYHLLELVRAPLLGGQPTSLNWTVGLGMAISGWFLAVFIFGKYKWRIAYWL